MFTRARGTLPREAAARGSGGEGPFPPVGAFRGSSSGAGAAHRRRAPGLRVRSGRAGAAGGCGGGGAESPRPGPEPSARCAEWRGPASPPHRSLID